MKNEFELTEKELAPVSGGGICGEVTDNCRSDDGYVGAEPGNIRLPGTHDSGTFNILTTADPNTNE